MNVINMLNPSQEPMLHETLNPAVPKIPQKLTNWSYNLHDDRFANIGYHEAIANSANPDTFLLMLKHVLQGVECETYDLRDASSREMNELRQEVDGFESSREKLVSVVIPTLKSERDSLQERHNEVMRDPAKLYPGESSFDATKQKIMQFGLMALTLFLYVFYFLVSHAAFVRNIGKTLENSDTAGVAVLFETVFDAAGVVRDFIDAPASLIICGLFPVVFMVVGYLFHQFHEDGKHGSAWVTLAVIVGLDCALAYKVTSKMHEAQLLSGLTDEKWHFSMIFTDVTFYIILLSGLAVYLLWGALLKQYLEENRKSDRLGAFLEGHKEKIAAIAAEIKSCEDKVVVIENSIRDKRARMAKLDEPGILVAAPWQRIEQAMDSFTAGWSKGITAFFKGEQERLATEERSRSNELVAMLEASKMPSSLLTGSTSKEETYHEKVHHYGIDCHRCYRYFSLRYPAERGEPAEMHFRKTPWQSV